MMQKNLDIIRGGNCFCSTPATRLRPQVEKPEAEDEKSRTVLPVLFCSTRGGQRGDSPKEGTDKTLELQAAATWTHCKPWGWARAHCLPAAIPGTAQGPAGLVPAARRRPLVPVHLVPSLSMTLRQRRSPKGTKFGWLRFCIRLGLHCCSSLSSALFSNN